MSVISLHMAADCTSSSGHMIPYSSHPRSCTSRSDLWGSNMMLFGVTKRTPLTIPWKTENRRGRWQWNIGGPYTTLPWPDLIITAKMEHIVLVIAHWLFWPQNAHFGRKRSTWNATSQAFGFAFLVLFGGKSKISDTKIKDQHGIVVYRINCSNTVYIKKVKMCLLCSHNFYSSKYNKYHIIHKQFWK